MRKTPFVLLLAAILGFAAVAQAQTSTEIIDFVGYAWEDGGFLPSNPGDELNIVGNTDMIDAVFGVNLVNDEVTIWVTDLISTGAVDLGGYYGITYVGGTIEVWQDPSQNHLFGTFPPNGTAPSTFVDGNLLLGGTLDSFVLYYVPGAASGSYDANVTWTAGSALSTVLGIQNDGFTFGGVLDEPLAGPTIPDGYDLQVDGEVQVKVIISVEDKTWSGVKGLYR
jgi:hypothetical protein